MAAPTRLRSITSIANEDSSMSTRKSPPALNRYVLPIPERVPPHDTPMNAKEAQSPPAKEFMRPPAGAPNVLIVLIDDMGFGASSAFGGPCLMPNAERVAKDGIRFTRFQKKSSYARARCAH